MILIDSFPCFLGVTVGMMSQKVFLSIVLRSSAEFDRLLASGLGACATQVGRSHRFARPYRTALELADRHDGDRASWSRG